MMAKTRRIPSPDLVHRLNAKDLACKLERMKILEALPGNPMGDACAGFGTPRRDRRAGADIVRAPPPLANSRDGSSRCLASRLKTRRAAREPSSSVSHALRGAWR